MKHWTEDDFTNWLYGLKDDAAHLAECAACAAESVRLLEMRRRMLAAPEPPRAFFEAQRRAVYRRMDGNPGPRLRPRWAVSIAAMALAALLGVASLRPARAPAPLYTNADQQLFSDLVSIEQSNEPRAIKPIRNLFEE